MNQDQDIKPNKAGGVKLIEELGLGRPMPKTPLRIGEQFKLNGFTYRVCYINIAKRRFSAVLQDSGTIQAEPMEGKLVVDGGDNK